LITGKDFASRDKKTKVSHSQADIFNCFFNWFACCIACDVRPLCMEIKTNMLEIETNVLYNMIGFLFTFSFIPCVGSIYLEIEYQ
jgi:hypothetical protein